MYIYIGNVFSFIFTARYFRNPVSFEYRILKAFDLEPIGLLKHCQQSGAKIEVPEEGVVRRWKCRYLVLLVDSPNKIGSATFKHKIFLQLLIFVNSIYIIRIIV